MRPLEWDSSDWVEQLKKENHLGGRLPGERLKAAVAKVIAFNRSQKFIANPDAETLKEVHAARDAEQEPEAGRLPRRDGSGRGGEADCRRFKNHESHA